MLDEVEFKPKSIKCDKGGMLLGLRGFNRNAYATNNTATTFIERELQERGGKWTESQHSQEAKHTALGQANNSCSSNVVGKMRQTLGLCMKFTSQ